MIQKIYNSEYNITINNKEYPKVALCAIVKRKKWESIYTRMDRLLQNMRINKIIYYDNNDIDGEKLEGIISNYIENGFVDVFDRRRTVLQNITYGKST